MIGLLVTGHANFGSGLTSSLNLIAGEQQQYQYVDFLPTYSMDDLARELIAIMLIPGLVRRSRSTALGLCGATSMDFTLPVLQRSGGLEMVPAAIVHGFILSLLVPMLMAFFSA